jgi:hypothetical protein
LLTVPPNDRCRRLQPNADAATVIDIGAFGRYSADDILGSQYRRHLCRPMKVRISLVRSSGFRDPYGGATKEGYGQVGAIERRKPRNRFDQRLRVL